MFNKLTLRDRIFLISFMLILLAISMIWIFIRPNYKEAIINERTTIVTQLQEYSLRQVDQRVRVWLNSLNRFAEDLSGNPEQTEILVEKAINYTPGLMRILISEPNSNQNIDIKKRIFNETDFTLPTLNWTPSRLDPQISFVWYYEENNPNSFFVAERAIQIGEDIYYIRLFYDSNPLNDALLIIPLGGQYKTNILNSSGAQLIVDESIKFPKELIGDASYASKSAMTISGSDWFVLSSRFETLPLWHLVAVEESYVLQPVRTLLIFTMIAAGGILSIMLFFSWYVSNKVNQPIQKLLTDVSHLSELNFSHHIDKVNLPEFEAMRVTLDDIRMRLERYQQLNVEKIILEEWKNRYMMTYSEDMVGIIGEDGKFSFINNQMMFTLRSLGLNSESVTLNDILSNKSVNISKPTQALHSPDPFTVRIDQSELSITHNDGNAYYYDFQLLAISDKEGNEMGAYVMIHDKTEDRLLDVKRNDMINIIVHELKNPITGVVGLSEILMKESSFTIEDQKNFISEIHISGTRMNNLVNRFLEVQRLESNQKVEFSRVHLNSLISDVVTISKPHLNSKDLLLNVSANKENIVLEANRELLFDAIQILVSNALNMGKETEQ